MLIVALSPLCVKAQGVADVINRLEMVDCYLSSVKYEVSMPQQGVDVVYSVQLMSQLVNDDNLSMCDYMIDWVSSNGVEMGFSAYFDGHHYRYRNYGDNQLQEYHFTEDSIPFLLSNKKHGIHRTTQFGELLPQYMGDDISTILSDSRYSVTLSRDTVISGVKRDVLNVSLTVQSHEYMKSEYVFDIVTGMPVLVKKQRNMGTEGEQSTVATYNYCTAHPCLPLTEKQIKEHYNKYLQYGNSLF